MITVGLPSLIPNHQEIQTFTGYGVENREWRFGSGPPTKKAGCSTLLEAPEPVKLQTFMQTLLSYTLLSLHESLEWCRILNTNSLVKQIVNTDTARSGDLFPC